jgi:hypothetical protein
MPLRHLRVSGEGALVPPRCDHLGRGRSPFAAARNQDLVRRSHLNSSHGRWRRLVSSDAVRGKLVLSTVPDPSHRLPHGCPGPAAGTRPTACRCAVRGVVTGRFRTRPSLPRGVGTLGVPPADQQQLGDAQPLDSPPDVSLGTKRAQFYVHLARDSARPNRPRVRLQGMQEVTVACLPGGTVQAILRDGGYASGMCTQTPPGVSRFLSITRFKGGVTRRSVLREFATTWPVSWSSGRLASLSGDGSPLSVPLELRPLGTREGPLP